MLTPPGQNPPRLCLCQHGGYIGPLAVVRPDALGSAFTIALARAVEIGSSLVSAFVPGAGEGSKDRG